MPEDRRERADAALRSIAAALTSPDARVADGSAPRCVTAGSADEGGDPACWLDRVCPHCGAIPDAGPPPAVCPRCGTPREDVPSDDTPGGTASRAADPPAG